ncbi:MAG: hypothetical protein ACTSYF_07290 [Promethearchaeota archaeon]
MSEDYGKLFQELKNQNDHVEKGCVFDGSGKILFNEGDWDPAADIKNVLDVWTNHRPRIEIQGVGFSVLKSEPENLVAKNVTGKGSIVGSITKEHNYFIVKLPNLSTEQVGRDSIDVARCAAKMK